MGKKSGPKKMATKGRNKSISNVKKTNLKRHKLVKAGKLKPISQPRFVEGGHMRAKKQGSTWLPPADLQERERLRLIRDQELKDEAYDELVESLDPEDVAFLRKMHGMSSNAAAARRTQPSPEPDGHNDEEEEQFEAQTLDRYERRCVEEGSSKVLLPIRTKDGRWVYRSVDHSEQTVPGHGDVQQAEEALSNGGGDDDDDDNDNNSDQEQPEQMFEAATVSVIDIVAKRKALLADVKLQIGTMANHFLEMPEERLSCLNKLIGMISSDAVDVSIRQTVTELAAATVMEILKDVLPNYHISDHEATDKKVKLKKDTLRLHKYETGLLNCVKSYLIKLEKLVSQLRSGRKTASHARSMFALKCICQLFVCHPNFNFTSNLVQLLVPYLNSSFKECRTLVASSLEQVFRGDKKGEVSLAIVRQINHYLKPHKKSGGYGPKVKPETLTPLLALKLYHLSNGQLSESSSEHDATSNEHSRKGSKKSKFHREPIVSKKEKKRLKEKEKLERELLEAKGEESMKTKLKNATDIANLLFAIYFRVLKSVTAGDRLSGHDDVLEPILTGLARFGHLMSIEYFQDLLTVLSNLLQSVDPGQHHKQLLCLKTVFTILSGQGDNLTLDPARFYSALCQVLLRLNLLHDDMQCSPQPDEGPDQDERDLDSSSSLLLSVLRNALIARRKKVSRCTVAEILKILCVTMLQQSTVLSVRLVDFIRELIFVAHAHLAPMLEAEDSEEGVLISSVYSLAAGASTDRDPFHLLGHQPGPLWELTLMANHVSPAVSEAVHTSLLATKEARPRKRVRPLMVPEGVDPLRADLEDCRFDILSGGLGVAPDLRKRLLK